MASPGPILLPPSATVIHIRQFHGIGHAPNDKYGFVIGSTADGGLLFFLISTQDYSQTRLARETIFIPPGTCSALKDPNGCWIQCFHKVEFYSAGDFAAGVNEGKITVEGRLPQEFLGHVKRVVQNSYVLMQREIEECLSIIP